MRLSEKSLLIITVLFILLGVVFFGHSSNYLIDYSREISIPYQMNCNKVLFRDIFLIYGFWGYFVNSFLFKCIHNIVIFLILSNILSYLFVVLFYLILKKYVSNKCALLFSVAFILCSVHSCATFSFVVPYSYSVLWAYFASYLLFASILYKKTSFVFISLSLLSVTRIEIFLPLVIFVFVYLLIKKQKTDYNFLLLFLFPLIFLGYILINKISFSDIILNFEYLKKMLNSPSLVFLYKGMGVFFYKDYFVFNLLNLSIYLSVFLLTYFVFQKFNKYVSAILLILLFSLCNVVFVLNLALFVLIILFTVLCFRKKISRNDSILFVFSLILSMKSIFAMNIWGYGNFSYILVIFNIYLLL